MNKPTIVCPHCEHDHGYEWSVDKMEGYSHGMDNCKSCEGFFGWKCTGEPDWFFETWIQEEATTES